MLKTVIIVMCGVWLAGMATAYTLGGLIHILPIFAVASVAMLVVEHYGQQRVVDLEPVPVVDEAQALEFLHEEVHA
jgi:hypothetical protein